MRAYAVLAEEKYNLPVYPVLVNILPPTPEMAIATRYESEIFGLKALQDYQVINLWEVDAQTHKSKSFRVKLNMSIIGMLKQITPYMLDTLKKNPVFVALLLNSHWMSDDLDYSKYIQSYPFASLKDKDDLKQLQDFERKYPDEFEKIKVDISVESESELDLHKYYDSIHYLLTWDTSFRLPYLVSKNLEIDELPLVNAIFGGTGIGYEMGYVEGEVTYLTSKEVKQIAKALQEITRKGFRERYKRAAKLEEPVCFIDWEEKEMLSWLTHYYNEITFYYKDAARKNNAMLIYFT